MIPAFCPNLAISLHQETVNSLDTVEKGNFIQAIATTLLPNSVICSTDSVV